ncbi:hypothetical protein VFPBJ_11687 [Purpureocillium lilacinum]|uniref:Uncharacterized protein n=1 Tax=Purpureocillium lilacinum TaxID=33203 RepID=A0A179EYX8_PURLI|nr:hypothetical protein VFPBJ_11687 [Purpureocillium lilacinum]
MPRLFIYSLLGCLMPTRGGRDRATLRPLSRIALTLSRSVISIACPSSTNMLRVSCHESQCRSVVTSGPRPGCPPHTCTSTMASSRNCRSDRSHFFTRASFHRLWAAFQSLGPASRVTLRGPDSSHAFFGSVANDCPAPRRTMLSEMRLMSSLLLTLAHEWFTVSSMKPSASPTKSRIVFLKPSMPMRSPLWNSAFPSPGHRVVGCPPVRRRWPLPYAIQLTMVLTTVCVLMHIHLACSSWNASTASTVTSQVAQLVLERGLEKDQPRPPHDAREHRGVQLRLHEAQRCLPYAECGAETKQRVRIDLAADVLADGADQKPVHSTVQRFVCGTESRAAAFFLVVFVDVCLFIVCVVLCVAVVAVVVVGPHTTAAEKPAVLCVVAAALTQLVHDVAEQPPLRRGEADAQSFQSLLTPELVRPVAEP